MGRIVALRCAGARLVVDPTTEAIADVLLPSLTFRSKKLLYGREAYAWRQAHGEDGRGPVVTYRTHHLYAFDIENRIYTARGMHEQIAMLLSGAGYTVEFIDTRNTAELPVYHPNWDNLKAHEADRAKQRDILRLMCTNLCGRIDYPTGAGKSYIIAKLTRLLVRAKFHIIVPGVRLCRQMYDNLVAEGVDAHLVCGTTAKDFSHRITVLSADSLHRSDGRCDIMIGDECHALCTEKYIGHLARYTDCRSFGMSASHDMRLDKLDPRVEAVFGPMLIRVSYQEALDAGLVNPIAVLWRRITQPAPKAKNKVGINRLRWAVWRNRERNEAIAADARKYAEDVPVLITTEKLEHAVRLKHLLPEFTLVYAPIRMGEVRRHPKATRKETWRDYYIRQGWLLPDEPLMTDGRLEMLRKDFAAGRLNKVIATTVWNTGVDFKRLAVLIRADAGNSPISDTQIPGRTSRILDGKDASIVHDYWDEFDGRMLDRSRGRSRTYKLHQWEQLREGQRQKRLL